MKRAILSVFLFCLIFLGISFRSAYASYIFTDDFSTGKTNWIPTAGPDLWDVKNGEYGATITQSGITIESVAGNISVPDYVEEFDMHPISGLDKNVDFRWINNADHYEVHFNNPSGGNIFGKVGPTQDGWPKFTNFYPENGQIYHFKIVLSGQRVVIYVNGNLLFDVIDPDYQFSVNEQVGFRISSGSTSLTEVRFDNVVVRDIEPGDLPGQDLNVTSLKQISDPWQSQMYDSADVWSPLNSTIGRWGCALTSAAMVFNYQGLTKLSDAEPLNPGTLNTWLKNQPDGYIRSGWINWLALSRLSKQITGINGVTGFDALEYKRENNQNDTVLTSDLTNGNPDILEEPGHFVVAKGTSGAGFDINDPFYNISSLFDGYGNTYLSIGRYIPSFTDLSYIMLVIDDTTQVSLNDGSGTPVGSIYTQNPIKDPISGVANGTALKFVYLPVPQAGNYNITVSGLINQQYTLGAYLYSVDGNVNKIVREGFAGPGTQDRYILSYNNQNVSNTSAEKLVDFNTTRSDVNEAAAIGEVRSGNPLLSSLSNAENNWHNGNLEKAQTDMNLFIKHLDSQRGKGITESAYQILHYDSVYIKTHVL